MAQNGAKMICESPKNSKEFKNAWQISISTIGTQWYKIKPINFCLEESFPGKRKHQKRINQVCLCPLDGEMHPLEKKFHKISIPIYFFTVCLQINKKDPSKQNSHAQPPTNSCHISPRCQGALKPSPYSNKKQQIQAFVSSELLLWYQKRYRKIHHHTIILAKHKN